VRVLYCTPNGGAFSYITQSIIRCLKAAGIPTERWDGKNRQQIERLQPTVYMGCSGHPQNYPEWARKKYGTKIGIHVNPYCTDKMPKVHGVDIMEPGRALNWTIKQDPDFVYCYADGKQIDRWYHMWADRHHFRIVPMENAGDPLLYHPTEPDERFTFDIGFLGGYWGYKAHNLDKYIVPLQKRYNCGVFGWGGWGSGSRRISDTEGNKLFSSCKICPAVSEPHTTDYGIDIPERLFKVPLSGGFTISDPVYDIERITKDVIPLAKTQGQWFELIDHYLKNPDKRKKEAKEQRKYILENHTYFDRMANLFEMIGHPGAAKKLLDYKNGIIAKDKTCV